MKTKAAILAIILALSSVCFGLQADINEDGRVDFLDLAILTQEWLELKEFVQDGSFDVEELLSPWDGVGIGGGWSIGDSNADWNDIGALDNTLSQSLVGLKTGHAYNVRFALSNGVFDDGHYLEVKLGDTMVGLGNEWLGPGCYNTNGDYEYSIIADSNDAAISFTGVGDGGQESFVCLDDVSVKKFKIDLRANCIGHWKMNDNANDKIVIDSTGKGCGGLADGSTIRDTSDMHTTGRIDGALAFNGTTDVIKVIDYRPHFKIVDSHVLGGRRCNQGIAKDENGNFYTFGREFYIDEVFYLDVITKYDSNWNFVKEWKSTNGKFAGDDKAWALGDGNVINGKLYNALRKGFEESAIGVWDLDLNYESIHAVEGGQAEQIELYDGYYWIIQGSQGDKARTIAKYNTSWEHQTTYDLASDGGYDGFAWVNNQILCNKYDCIFDVYDFNDTSFTRVERKRSLGDEGFYTDGTTFYFAGLEDNIVWECVAADEGEKGFNAGTGDLTLACWVLFDVKDKYQRLISKEIGSVAGYYLCVASVNHVTFIISDSNGNLKKVRSPLALDLFDGEWHFIVIVFDYDDDVYLWIDHILYNSYQNDTFDSTTSNDVNLGIGAMSTSGGKFTGTIDNVVIFNRALSSKEIAFLYNDGFGTEGLFSEW